MDNLALVPLTLCLSKATLAAGTTTTYSTTGTTVYAIAGKAYSTAAKTNVATPTVDIVDGLAFTPVTFPASASVGGTGSIFVFCFDSGGTLRVAQGTVEALDLLGNFINAPQFPIIPDTVCPFGYLVVKLGATAVANWTFGSSNLSAVTGVTYAFQDLVTLPSRPQVA